MSLRRTGLVTMACTVPEAISPANVSADTRAPMAMVRKLTAYIPARVRKLNIWLRKRVPVAPVAGRPLW